MCCNGFKKAVPQLHSVASTWSYSVELPVWIFILGICADSGLTVYSGDKTDTYAHLPAPNNTYLVVDNAYSYWYKENNNRTISKRMVLLAQHALQMKNVDENNL